VRRDLTVPYDAANPLPALRRIAARSVAQEQAPFATRSRLVNVLTDAAGAAAAPAAKAELSLLRLHALQKALDEHARGGGAGYDARPLREGRIRADSSDIVYGEPQGQWFVSADAFWKLRDRFRALTIAERIAWAAASHDLPGECEGDVTCTFAHAEITMGRYLSLHPTGVHSAAALRELKAMLEYVESETRPRETHARFCRNDGRDDTLTPARLRTLRATVQRSAGAERDAVALILWTLMSRCR